jgi:uncharacterized protein YjbI with pentapeptide repeats
MNTKLSESDFSSAILIECHFVNCDLTDVLGLTNEQAMSAVFDKSTVIPKHIDSSALRYMD